MKGRYRLDYRNALIRSRGQNNRRWNGLKQYVASRRTSKSFGPCNDVGKVATRPGKASFTSCYLENSDFSLGVYRELDDASKPDSPTRWSNASNTSTYDSMFNGVKIERSLCVGIQSMMMLSRFSPYVPNSLGVIVMVVACSHTYLTFRRV